MTAIEIAPTQTMSAEADSREAVGCVAIKNLCHKIDFSTSDAPALPSYCKHTQKYIVVIILRHGITSLIEFLQYKTAIRNRAYTNEVGLRRLKSLQ